MANIVSIAMVIKTIAFIHFIFWGKFTCVIKLNLNQRHAFVSTFHISFSTGVLRLIYPFLVQKLLNASKAFCHLV
jgi:hypothetical protein